MNKMEKAIFAGAIEAQDQYEEMTGRWLWHGPESFFMSVVAGFISKETDMMVCLDFSPKRIDEERDKLRRGRPPTVGQAKRFDLVIWYKTSQRVRAIVEIKRAWHAVGMKKDRKKIRKYLKNKEDIEGYLLVYTDAKGKNRERTLKRRKKNWCKKLKCTHVQSHIVPKADKDYGWGIYLYRLK